MFGINKNSNTPLVKSQERFDTLIGRQTEIQGTLRVVQSVRIDGKVIGNIEASKENAITVVIGLEGEVQGDVIASRVIVAGKVAGNIDAHERVELMASALVQGDVKYGSIAVEHGARLMGLLLQVDVSKPQVRQDQAQTAITKAKATGKS
ncbi:polymer-forming cytoskeletal protein [Limnohabitans sp.]|jgi:cytoskeletal protein CcmA (bactofilin family)|uniref:bactofilin family protein n=1 Tax=Limnohabitans sp. TaxID=1907725 RepID=UPI00260A1781|nr:polymer-forming cytoskeletal protein [Limnohabitans sp.]